MGNISAQGIPTSQTSTRQTLAFQPAPFAASDQTPPTPIATNQPADSVDLETQIERFKAQSLTYQLLKAIASQSSDRKQPDSNEINNLSFAQSIRNSFQFSQSSRASDSQVPLDIDFNFTAQLTSEFSINRVSPQSNLSIGVDIDIDIDFQSEFSFSLNVIDTAAEDQHSDPLIINLDDTGFAFSSNQTILFDLDADGQLDQISQLSPGNVFLALDKNQNGAIDDGHELFGDLNGSANGFIELAKYDDDNNGQIDANDRVFHSLILSNLHPTDTTSIYLAETNITSLSTDYTETQQNFVGDNRLIAQSWYRRNDGSIGQTGDFLLKLNQ